MGAAKIAVVPAFEAKLQPILAASAAGALRKAGAQVTAWEADACPNDFPGGGFDLVLISILLRRHRSWCTARRPVQDGGHPTGAGLRAIRLA
ncbi:MAG TPA: hypothetical protein DHU96_05505 [Actinobacteria bacterium]|nr:hypothetical protein [Actinomycetota bacterium]